MFSENISLYLDYAYEFVEIILNSWVFWICILWSFCGSVMVPSLFFIFSFATILYRRVCGIQEPYEDSVWDSYRKKCASMISYIGFLWHGFEIVGAENLPNNKTEGALLIFYHGPFPVDAVYFLTKFLKTKKIKAYTDYRAFNTPGYAALLNLFRSITGDLGVILDALKEGYMVILAPGGVFEGQFTDNHYRLMWQKRNGFAKAALEAKVPIIPVFTQNINEAFRTINIGKRFIMKLYNIVKFPLIPIYGGLPVKLRTFIGEPIPYDPSLTPDQLAEKTARAVESLIAKHQRIPGNVFRALTERFS